MITRIILQQPLTDKAVYFFFKKNHLPTFASLKPTQFYTSELQQQLNLHFNVHVSPKASLQCLLSVIFGFSFHSFQCVKPAVAVCDKAQFLLPL